MFNVFNGILKNKKLTPEDRKKINAYLFKRWVSGNIDGLMFSSFINSFDLKEEILYEYFRCLLAPKKIKYIPWTKEDKDLEEIEIIASHYKISREKAREYCELLDKDQIQEIKEYYGGRVWN